VIEIVRLTAETRGHDQHGSVSLARRDLVAGRASCARPLRSRTGERSNQQRANPKKPFLSFYDAQPVAGAQPPDRAIVSATTWRGFDAVP